MQPKMYFKNVNITVAHIAIHINARKRKNTAHMIAETLNSTHSSMYQLYQLILLLYIETV